MRLESQEIGNILVVKVGERRFAADNAADFKQEAGNIVQDWKGAVLLDLSAVEFMDSTAVGAVISVLKALGISANLMVAGLSESMAYLFTLTRMDKVLRIYPSVEEALSAAK